MPARKKVVKRKAVKQKTKRKSSFSFKKLFAPFLVLAGVAVVLSYTLLPKHSVLSSQVASTDSTSAQQVRLLDGGYLKIPLSKSDSFNQGICRTRSIEFFITQDMKEIGGNGASILSRWVPENNGGVNGPYYISINTDKKLLAGVKANSGNSGGAGLTSRTVFEPGIRHHVALEYVTTGSDVAKQGLYLFVDGVLEDFSDVAKGNMYCPSGGELNIGSASTPFRGGIDELRFSTVPRYAPSKAYKVPTARFGSDANTSGLWYFNGNLSDYGPYRKPFQAVGKYEFESIDSSETLMTPTPADGECGNITLGKYTYADACSRGTTYKSFTFSCTDGFGYTIGGSTSACRTLEDFKKEASEVCAGRTATCVVTPTQDVTPTQMVTPTQAKQCKATMQYVRTKTACKPFKSGSTTGMEFGCSDGYVGKMTSATCTSSSKWTSIAKSECAKRMTACK